MTAEVSDGGAGDATADRGHDVTAVADRLRRAGIEPLGRFADASNATLLVRLTDRDGRTLDELITDLGRDPGIEDLDPADLAVYKPERGEAPLWDFPAGTLHRREVAAYEVSAALGWDLVPVTVMRADAPYGIGSLQRFVPHDLDLHYFRLREVGDREVIDDLRRMVLFDLVIDNGDRKGGHVLLEAGSQPGVQSTGEDSDDGSVSGRVRVVDHGVSLHVEPKLRTVAWDFAGQIVDDALLDEVAALADAFDGTLGHHLDDLLHPAERDALRARIERVATVRVFPSPDGPRSYPWPPL